MSSEKATDMYELIRKNLTESGLEIRKIASITMDNTNANFGGINRNGRNNIFHFLKQGFINNLLKINNRILDNPKILGIGCSSHISDNAIHHAIDRMNYDLENFCNKIEAHFSNHALRWESFKKFADENMVIRKYRTYLFKSFHNKFLDHCPLLSRLCKNKVAFARPFD